MALFSLGVAFGTLGAAWHLGDKLRLHTCLITVRRKTQVTISRRRHITSLSLRSRSSLTFGSQLIQKKKKKHSMMKYNGGGTIRGVMQDFSSRWQSLSSLQCDTGLTLEPGLSGHCLPRCHVHHQVANRLAAAPRMSDRRARLWSSPDQFNVYFHGPLLSRYYNTGRMCPLWASGWQLSGFGGPQIEGHCCA